MTHNFKTIATLVFSILTSVTAGKFDAAVRAFESQPDYVKPAATLLGSFGGSGWNHRSSIPREFTTSISLPITFAIINDKDRSYTGEYTDSAIFNSALSSPEKNARAYKSYTTPTIFGRKAAPTLYRSVLGVDGDVIDSIPVYFSDGIEDMAAFNWMPLPALKLELSRFYTSLKLRYTGKPGGSLSIHYPGAGIQHDLRSFIPGLPLNITLFTNFSMPIVNWSPGEGIDGEIEMRGFSGFSGLTVGKKIKHFDIFMEMGMEYSRLSTGGELYIADDDEWIHPDMTIRGRNRFRMSLSVSFSPKTWYLCSGSASVGAEGALSVTPIAAEFRRVENNNEIPKD